MAERWDRVLDELRRRFSARADTGEVVDFLASRGYNRRQIGEILSLRAAQIGVVSGPGDGGAVRVPHLRVQGPHERGRFSAEAWGYLLALGGSGLVPLAAIEHMVERALLQVEGRIEVADLRALAEASGFDVASRGGERSLFH